VISFPVPHSAELDRILALPRRVWSPEQAAGVAEQMSRRLATTHGLERWRQADTLAGEARESFITANKMRLRPLQVQALLEAAHLKRLYLLGDVGVGKTLITWLIPALVHSPRPVLLVPASLREKTQAEFRVLSQQWRAGAAPLRVESYEMISADPAALEQLDPSLLILDEFDLLRHPRRGRTARVARFMRRTPVPVFAMSATDMRHSFGDFSHVLGWTHKEHSPLPLHYVELLEWTEATATKLRTRPRELGALRVFGADAGAVRAGIGQRIAETPGVIVSHEHSCHTQITINVLKAPDDPILDAAFTRFRETAMTQDDWPVADPLAQLRHASELACGFYYRWDPRPPMVWLHARRAWCEHVTKTIAASKRSMRPLDTEGQVARALPNAPELLAWRKERDEFGEPNSVPVPLSASVVGFAAQWLAAHGPALVWTTHRWFGETLSRMARVPYYGASGKSLEGASIAQHKPTHSAVLSCHSNRRGRNLQAFNRALYVGPEHSAAYWRQGVIGRMHRQGQTRDVEIDVLISCRENLAAVAAAVNEARGVEEARGQASQLLAATWNWDGYPALELDERDAGDPTRARF
jgi:hypothetical protein